MKPSKGLILCLVAPWLVFSVLGNGALAAAKAWYVSASVSQSGDGTSLEKAFKTIQEGINAAADGDTVTVAQGTYRENVEFKGKDIVLTGTNPLDPGVIAKTIIQGRRLGPTVTFSGTEKPSCSLSGFTVWDGKAGSGGAIRGNGTHATIGMNVITGGTADSYGGGLYECHGLIGLNVITVNSAGEGGGGLAFCNGTIQLNIISLCWSEYGGALYECDGTIENNTITDCVGSIYGGGGLYGCDGDILSNTIARNPATIGSGGGLAYCGKAGETSARIANNTITENTASCFGGGLFFCHSTIENNTIVGNSAGNDGGGLCGCDGLIQSNLIGLNSAGKSGTKDDMSGFGGGLCRCNGTIQNNLIAFNRALEWVEAEPGSGRSPGRGGGLCQCMGTIENNTIIGNVAEGSGGGGGIDWCDGTIRNCIVWANEPWESPQLAFSSLPTYSCIGGWWGGGEGNTALNPLLCDPDGPDDDPSTFEDNDCRLEWNSPCIDAGKNEPWMSGALDLYGNKRILFGGKSNTVDMGAYEYASFRLEMVEVKKTPGGQVELKWDSRPWSTYSVWSALACDATFGWYEATVPSQGTLTSWTGSSTASRQRFYRVELELTETSAPHGGPGAPTSVDSARQLGSRGRIYESD